MSPIRVTWSRTVGFAQGLLSTAFSTALFAMAAAASFSWTLAQGDGGRLPLVPLWASAVGLVLPAYAALLGMDTWSAERRTGRSDLLLTAPVLDRNLALGKFLGVWTILCLALLVQGGLTVVALRTYAPSALVGTGVLDFVPGFFALALQGALWVAVTLAMSVLFRHAALAALVSVCLTTVLPRAVWAAFGLFFPAQAIYGQMPFDAHATDLASGALSTAVIFGYATFIWVFLYIATLGIGAQRRLGGVWRRVQAGLAAMLAVVCGILWTVLLERFDFVVDLPGRGVGFSTRTLNALEEAHGRIRVTCFLSQEDPFYRSTAQLLRTLSRASSSRGGVQLDVVFVQPSWNLSEAERLVRQGVRPGSVLFENGPRAVVLPVDAAFGERLCASAILRLAMPARRRNVYWTEGHGEASFEDYGPFGLSDIARELSRNGYLNQSLDLAASPRIPQDCALIVVAGAKDDFSRMESGRLDAYLKQGGRLLVMMNSSEAAGVVPLLAAWGIRAESLPVTGVRTLTGTDVVVSGLGGHPVSAPLAGSQVVFNRPVSFTPSAAAGLSGGADRIVFSPLATEGALTPAAVAERGAGAGEDTAIRPTRIAALGDVGFVMNAQLVARANANRDFFLNCVAYLSGSHALTSGGAERDVLFTGMDRTLWLRFLAAGVLVLPLLVFGLLGTVSVCRRTRR